MKVNSLKSFPIRGWYGLALIFCGWLGNWLLPGLRSHLFFFPLWLGFCLAVDALVFLRKGSSLYRRSRKKYVGLFLVSAPAWWLFELINARTMNWLYEGREFFADWQYALFATLSFSTVIPAVFGTAELASTFKWLQKLRPGPRVTPSQRVLTGFFISGWVMLALLLLWPRYFFVLVWLSVWFILEPVNNWLHHRSILSFTAQDNWRPVLSLWTGCLLCGWFWEMWNFYSWPKWVYHVPFVSFWRIFEMPLLGYLGYIPFSLELFAFYHLVTGLLSRSGKEEYLQLL
ncbi:MAG TPA: hypothetical protein PLP19_19460 [bacterium]|nr:hypothetical protein [bacterium]HPN45675.1 hypothetical protein [bacterium]